MGLQTLPMKRSRKERLPWMESRLRRLRSIKDDERSVRQLVRIRQLERAIAELITTRKK
jgi:hypothetical protein